MELHYPGSNYMGPGTHVLSRLLRGVKPTSYNDALALKHDIEYLQDGEMFESDLRAAFNSTGGLQGALMKIGLLSRSAIDAFLHLFGSKFHLNKRPKGLSTDVYNKAKELAKPMLAEFNIDDDYVQV